ncbi:MAG: PQQ-dependent sugar dehydrogenase [Verrucomicrobiae bacterium]|nr:PQQ-dependent sugar dehydrogenase [Verrucomicrobiae bacterium]
MTRNDLRLGLTLALAGVLSLGGTAQTPAGSGAAGGPRLEEYRQHALTREGDAAQGARLFADEPKLACAKCHSTDGGASRAGPDLFAAGDAFTRRDLIEAVLLPSASIAPGYGTVTLETREGASFQGVLKQADDTAVQLMGGDGILVRIARGDIERQDGSHVSLMPEGLHEGLSLQEFTDLIEYLTTLRQPENTQVSNRGMPARIPGIARPIGLEPFFEGSFTVPRTRAQSGLTAFVQVPGAPDTFLVLHQTGLIWLARKTAAGEQRSVFSDLTGQVFYERGPNGLLGVAFHPKFRENRRYYLQHQVFEEGTVATVVVEREFSGDFLGDSGRPPRRLIKIHSVAEDHSGGWLEFGPDGFLYFAMGDTGPHHDPNGHAQDLSLLLGKMLRLDVDHRDPGLEYAVPADNPFIGRPEVRPEIWAYGLRNPWRFSFDRLTGDLWLADVGQDRAEEVALIRRGENHGWNVFEGFEPFSNQHRVAGRTFTPPVFAYRRKFGNSVTGGYVYRGDPQSSFDGVYVCGDFTSRILFGITQENGVLKAVRQLGVLPQSLVSFGTDDAGQLYAVGYEGMIYRLDFAESRFDEVQAE